MTKLVSYFPSVGYNREEITIFVASGTKKEFDLKLDNDEFITVVKMDIKKLIGMIKVGPKTAIKWIDEHGSLDGLIQKQFVQ